MRGMKLAVAIITIVRGSIYALSGLMLLFLGMIAGVSGSNNYFGNLVVGIVGFVFMFLGLIFIGFAALYLVLGIKFCGQKPDKGIAITLLVLSSIEAFFFLITFLADPFSIFMNFLNVGATVASIVLLSMYLSNLSKQGLNPMRQPTPFYPPPYHMYPPQPAPPQQSPSKEPE